MSSIRKELLNIGKIVRNNIYKRGFVFMPASCLGGYWWCGVRSWYELTLFNMDLLDREGMNEELIKSWGIAMSFGLLTELKKEVIRGRIVHGDTIVISTLHAMYKTAKALIDRPFEVFEGLRRKRAPLGLLGIDSVFSQYEKFKNAENIVEYFDKEDWPLMVRTIDLKGLNLMVMGVPDKIKHYNKSIIVKELKTTSRARSYDRQIFRRPALFQLEVYKWILADRCPSVKAVLKVRDSRETKVFECTRSVYEIEKEIIMVSKSLLSEQLPREPVKWKCRKCTYRVIQEPELEEVFFSNPLKYVSRLS